MRLKPIRDIPTTPCPVCVYGHTGPRAVAEHNERCSAYGERSYTAPRLTQRLAVPTDG